MLRNLLVSRTDSFFVQMFRYTFVGGLAFLADFGTLVGFTEYANFHYLISAAIAFLVGLTVNYVISIKWVFAARTTENRSLEFTIFAIIGIIGLALNELIMWLCTDLVGFHYALSKIASTAIVYFWNFIARRQILFRGEK